MRAPALVQLAILPGRSEQPLTAIAATKDGSGLVTAGLDGQLELWSHGDEPLALGTTARSAQCWQRTLTQPVGGGEINAMALCGSVLACGCQDGSVRLFRLLKEMGSFALYSLQRWQHSTHEPVTFAGRRHAPLLAGAQDGRSIPMATAAFIPSEVMCVALCAHPTRSAPTLASGAQDGTVCMWDSSGGKLLQRLEAHEPNGTGWVMAIVLARHEDNRSGLMLTASYDHTVRVWVRLAHELGGSAPTGQTQNGGFVQSSMKSCECSGFDGCGGGGSGMWALHCALKGHSDGVLAIELSRSRRLAFTGSDDHTVRVWELQKGTCLAVLREHSSNVHALGWHHSSGCLATGAEDGIVHLWDLTSLDQVQPEQQVNISETAAALRPIQSLNIEHCEILCITPSADGTALFCGLEDGTFAVLGHEPKASASLDSKNL